MVYSTYVLNPDQLHFTTYFLESGSPRFLRHELNDRFQPDAVDTYTKMILEHGVYANMRGQIIAVPSDVLVGPNTTFRIVSAATLNEAVSPAVLLSPYCLLAIKTMIG